MAIDLVYLTRPADDYTDLRYSIRSMVKHLQGIGDLVIVGEMPGFLKKAIHIPATDPYPGNRARNIYEKVLAAASHSKVSSDFICCSDDHYLLQDATANAFPFYYCSELEETIQKVSPQNYYREHLINTYHALIEKEHPSLNFNVHCPIVYNKEKYRMIMQGYEWTIKKGYLSKSLYCNSLKVEPTRSRDYKFHNPRSRAAIYRHTKDAPFFSTNDHALDETMKEVLQELFPDPSPWETL